MMMTGTNVSLAATHLLLFFKEVLVMLPYFKELLSAPDFFHLEPFFVLFMQLALKAITY